MSVKISAILGMYINCIVNIWVHAYMYAQYELGVLKLLWFEIVF